MDMKLFSEVEGSREAVCSMWECIQNNTNGWEPNSGVWPQEILTLTSPTKEKVLELMGLDPSEHVDNRVVLDEENQIYQDFLAECEALDIDRSEYSPSDISATNIQFWSRGGDNHWDNTVSLVHDSGVMMEVASGAGTISEEGLVAQAMIRAVETPLREMLFTRARHAIFDEVGCGPYQQHGQEPKERVPDGEPVFSYDMTLGRIEVPTGYDEQKLVETMETLTKQARLLTTIETDIRESIETATLPDGSPY